MSEQPQGEPLVGYEIGGPLEMPRWRPLVQWAMAFPHFIFAIAPIILGIVGWVWAWFAILFTGRMPVMAHNFITLWLRFHYRLYAFFFGLTTAYPPLTFSPGGPDDADHEGVTVTLPGLQAQTSRLALIHMILAIPHLLILAFLWIVFLLAGAVAWVAVLITASYPAGLRAFMIKVLAWQLRVQAYVGMLDGQYPRFGL
jgi:hypothetical protein